MNRYKIILLAFSLCILPAKRTHAQNEAESGAQNNPDVLKIVVTSLEVSDKTLKLRYEIRNDSEQDAWILAGNDKSSVDAAAFINKDGRILMIRKRLNVPLSGFGNPIDGRYVRLRSGQTQTESISLTLPFQSHPGLGGGRRGKGIEYVIRLSLEIGFYFGDLPEIIRGILGKEEKSPRTEQIGYPTYPINIIDWFGGLLGHNEFNEGLRSRDEEIMIPWTDQMLKGEQILQLTIDDLRIPYEEKEDRSRSNPPDLTNCTRVEIQCQPSILEYFFPYASQQGLLSTTEKNELRSLETIVIDDPERIKALANDVNKGVSTTGIVRERSMAHVVCYRDGERLMSFPIYNDWSIVTEGRYRFTTDKGFPSMRMHTPQIKPFELRMQCAANLKDLWYRLRLYHKAEKQRLKDSSNKSEMVYPAPTKWCDSMVLAYRIIGMLDYYIMRPHRCPDGSHGKSHYAMNPNCEPNSPPDTVLLFETKAGWNQHGGPELFTFDNHDPKGGCVLLNDSTVKFIRTKEGLHQLRWK